MRWPWQPKWIEIAGKRFRWVRGFTWVLGDENGKVVGEVIGGSAWLHGPTGKVGIFINSAYAKRAVENALLVSMGG